MRLRVLFVSFVSFLRFGLLFVGVLIIRVVNWSVLSVPLLMRCPILVGVRCCLIPRLLIFTLLFVDFAFWTFAFLNALRVFAFLRFFAALLALCALKTSPPPPPCSSVLLIDSIR